MNDMHATYQLIAKSTSIFNSSDNDNVKLLTHSGIAEVNTLLEDATDLMQLEVVCRNAEVFPAYDATKEALKRGQAIDLMLKASGKEPVLIYLTDVEQLRVGNQIMRLLESRVGSFDGTNQFIEAKDKLTSLGIDSPLELLSENPAAFLVEIAKILKPGIGVDGNA